MTTMIASTTMISYEYARRPIHTEAVLFQFSRNPQFITMGFNMPIFDSIVVIVVFIFMQLFMNCTAKLQKIPDMLK